MGGLNGISFKENLLPRIFLNSVNARNWKLILHKFIKNFSIKIFYYRLMLLTRINF